MQQKKDKVDGQAQGLRDIMSINIEGWVPLELYENAVAAEKEVRTMIRGDCENDEDRKLFDEQWPYQDHDEVD